MPSLAYTPPANHGVFQSQLKDAPHHESALRFQELQTSAGCGRAWRSPFNRQLQILLPAHATPLVRSYTTQLGNSTGGCSQLPPVPHVCACRELDVQPNPPLRGKTLVPFSFQPSPLHAALSVSSTFHCPSCTQAPWKWRCHQVPKQQVRHRGCRVCLGEALQCYVLQVLSHCCLSGLGTIPCPWCGQHAAYLLQVENHSLQDGVEGLPAALPSGCCQGGESSSDISVRIEREGKATPHPPPASPATTHVTHPRDGQHARAVPAHLSPCSTWLADGAAGRGALLPPGASAVLPPRCLCSAPPLPPCSGMGTRQCCLPGNAGFEGQLHLITSRQH